MVEAAEGWELVPLDVQDSKRPLCVIAVGSGCTKG